ncbi:MAG TPA: MauE/DoxX family redox-associated membrane protein [Ilumatobacter sp.]
MSAVAFVASVVLGLTFVVAGGSKLAAGPAWPVQAGELGAPAAAAPVVPWVEIVVGALLVVQLFEPVPALAAIVMIVAFSALIGRRLAQGRRPVCACFGAWSAKPIGPGHLVRNGALLVVAALAAAG